MMQRSREKTLKEKEMHDMYRDTKIDLRGSMSYIRELENTGRNYDDITFDEIKPFIISCPDLEKFKERWEENEYHRKNINHSRNGTKHSGDE